MLDETWSHIRMLKHKHDAKYRPFQILKWCETHWQVKSIQLYLNKKQKAAFQKEIKIKIPVLNFKHVDLQNVSLLSKLVVMVAKKNSLRWARLKREAKVWLFITSFHNYVLKGQIVQLCRQKIPYNEVTN